MRKRDNKRILIVDDDPGVRQAIADSLFSTLPENKIINKAAELFGQPAQAIDRPEIDPPQYELTKVPNGSDGVIQVKMSLDRNTPFAMAFIDMQMPGLNGAQTAKKIWAIDPRIKIVIVTAFSEYSVEDIVQTVGREDLIYLRKPFTAEEIRQLARSLTRQWNMEQERRALSKALKLTREQEIATAARIQQALLIEPAPNHLSSIQTATLTIASKQVDGDFFDFFTINDSCIDLVVGDVMGKGVPAALLGAAAKNRFLRTFNRLMLSQGCSLVPEPEEVVAEVQKAMIHHLESLESFITLCYARIDTAGRIVQYVDCGHTRTIHYHYTDGSCDLLEGVNMPLGFPEISPFQQIHFTFEPGDVFFFYSDGLTEAANAGGELLGEERLVNLVRQNGHVSDCRQLIDIIKDSVITFSGSKTFQDDFTCVALKIQTEEQH